MITQSIFDDECRSLADEIRDEYETDEERHDMVHEYVDGHEWVVYHANVAAIVWSSDIDTTAGRECVEVHDGPTTLEDMATAIVYHQMVHDVTRYLNKGG